jgi:ADP-heptose:LPS heptosyltransferase
VVKFLVIRLSSIGDIVLTSPVIRCIKNQIGDSEVHFLTKFQYSAVLSNNPNIDRLWLLQNNLSELIEELKSQNFDYIIDLHNNLRTWRIKNKLRCLAFSYNKLNFQKWLLVNFKINKLPEKHIVDRYMDTLSIFGVVNDDKGLDYYTSPEDEIFTDEITQMLPVKYAALCIGAQHNTKKATPESLAVFCDHATLPVVILGGNEDVDAANKILRLSNNKNLISLAGRLRLNQSAVIVRKAELVVSHDTGLMHIAAAYKKRIISLWGNTIPEFGMYPYMTHPDSMIFENKSLSCRPCSKIGFSQCPQKHFKCMLDLDYKKMGEAL